MNREEMIYMFARERAEVALSDAENCTNYREEFTHLAYRLGERMTDEELSGWLNDRDHVKAAAAEAESEAEQLVGFERDDVDAVP